MAPASGASTTTTRPTTANAATITAKNQTNSWWLADSAGKRHHGASFGPSATACSAPSMRLQCGGRGSSRPGRSLNTGSRTMPRTTFDGPAMIRWTTIGISPTARPAPAPRATPGRRAGERHSSQPWASAEGEDQVRPVAEGEPGEQAGRGRRPPAPRPVGVQRAHATHDAPDRQGDAALPGQRRQADRGEHEERRGERADDGHRPAPRPGEGEHAEDQGDVLQQAEHPLGAERGSRTARTSRPGRAARTDRRGGGSRRWARRRPGSARGRRA